MRKNRSSKILTAPCDRSICLRWAALVFGTIATLLMAVACAPSKKGSNKGSMTFVTTIPNEKAALMYASPQLVCETPGGNCPDAVALMASREQVDPQNTEIRQCTSFLVGRNIMATNSHCLPPDLRKAGASCSGRIQVVFGKTGLLPQQSYECEQILSASEIADESDEARHMTLPDYAFFRLKKDVVRRKPLKLNREGLPDRLELRILAIDPSKDEKIDGTLRIRTCSTTQGTLNIPGYVHNFSPLAAAGNCNTIKGNSGSAAIDENGQVRALHFGASLPEKFQSTNIDAPEKLTPSAYLVNVACMAIPTELRMGEKNPRCDSQTITKQQLFDRARSKAKSRAPELFAKWKETAPKAFGYLLDDSSLDGVAFVRVACLNDKSLISEGAKTAEISVPVWGTRIAVTSESRVLAVSKEITQAQSKITVQNLNSADQEPLIQYSELITGNLFGRSERSGELPLCD